MTVPQTTADFPFHVVLYQPEIPQNTGNVGRTCTALGAKLWLVRPMAFRLDSSQLKRSGMDYWHDLNWEVVDSWQHLQSRLPRQRFWLVTKTGSQVYTSAEFRRGDVFVFGNETTGLPQSIHSQHSSHRIAIPMPGGARCLNLATSAGIVLYEAARQTRLLGASEKSMGSQLCS